MKKLKRIFKHLFSSPLLLKKYFNSDMLKLIEKSIAANEKTHAGQIRFVVENDIDIIRLLSNVTSRQRAIELFSSMHIWDTEHNNGVLIYLLFCEHKVEIVADRGIHALVGDAQWQKICHEMEAYFRQHDFAAGVIHGIDKIGDFLREHYPHYAIDNELPDAPVVL